MTKAERGFYQLMAELASDGLFNDRDGIWERIVESHEAAVEAVRVSQLQPIERQPERHPQQ